MSYKKKCQNLTILFVFLLNDLLVKLMVFIVTLLKTSHRNLSRLTSWCVKGNKPKSRQREELQF